MKPYAIHIAISGIAVLLAVVHLVFPTAQIDAITLALLAIAALPWLGSIFKAVELPGGLKVEYQELEDAKRKIQEAGLLAASEKPSGEPVYVAVAEEDPNLALAGLRIEIERRLRAIAKGGGVVDRHRGIGQMTRELTANQLLTKDESSALADLIGLLNNAVHGAEVDQRAAEWAFEVGPHLLASLDERIKEVSQEQRGSK